MRIVRLVPSRRGPRGGRCGWVARWACGLRRVGPVPPVRGPPEGRGHGSPHQRTGPVGPPAGWLRAALRGWAALACLRASPAPCFPSQLAGPPAVPAAGWAAPRPAGPRRVPVGGASRRRLRPVLLRGVGRRGIAAPWGEFAPRHVGVFRRCGGGASARCGGRRPLLRVSTRYKQMGQRPRRHTRRRFNKTAIYFVESSVHKQNGPVELPCYCRA